MSKTNKILLALSIFMVIFVSVVLWIFYKTSAEPSVLITVVGGAVITEIVALCKLKTQKRKIAAKKEESAD